jgi:predicted nuclease with TOPRIM domain
MPTFFETSDGCPTGALASGCDCRPKMYLTKEEESILSELREIKQEVRLLMDKIKMVAAETGTATGSVELSDLSGRLDTLREAWSGWENKLDQAIEDKLIMLGHRQP